MENILTQEDRIKIIRERASLIDGILELFLDGVITADDTVNKIVLALYSIDT